MAESFEDFTLAGLLDARFDLDREIAESRSRMPNRLTAPCGAFESWEADHREIERELADCLSKLQQKMAEENTP